MRRNLMRALLCALVSAPMLVSCGDPQPPIIRVQTNVAEKSVFTGSWYMGRTVIELEYEGASLDFVGNNAGDGTGGFLGFSIPRVRWVIDEDFLYAYRDYETVADGEEPQRVQGDEDIDYLGQPVAVFGIDSHFDIRREYNPVTREERNVLVENTEDRHWYERQFMRVDWSRNLLTSYFGNSANLQEIFGTVQRDPVDLFVQPNSDFPEEWEPKFHRMTCASAEDESEECLAADRDWADDYDLDELYSMSFVTQEVLSPGSVGGFTLCKWSDQIRRFFPSAPECASINIFIRTSFLKVSDTREYVPTAWTNTRFNRAGYFALDRPTFDRTSEAGDPSYWLTDFTNESANRHNIWKQWYVRDEATGAIQLDGDGRPRLLPYGEREVRPIVWYTSTEVPGHLVKPSFEVISQWNSTLMETVRTLRGEALPSFPDASCQSEDPGGYCYCQRDPETGDVLNPTCPGLYDPFETPDQARERGVSNPFDCYVEVPEGAEPDWGDPASAGASDEAFHGWFDAEMRGEECVNELRVNTCHAGNQDQWGELDCQQRGDLRFKLLSMVNQPGTPFLGVAQLRGDPITGEIIYGDANIGRDAMDRQRTFALQTFDLVAGNITDEEFYIGEDVRSFLENVNNVSLPAPPRVDFNAALQQGGVGIDETFRAGIDRQMARAMERAEQLRGPTARATRIFSERLSRLAGTDIERQVFADMNESLLLAGMSRIPENMTFDVQDEILEMASPYRHDLNERLNAQTDFHTRLGLTNMIMPNQYVDNSVLNFVRQHADWDRVRVEFELNRRLYRDTQIHEMGHCLGLRHHFGGTSDVGNFFDGYYTINDEFRLPDPQDPRYDLDGQAGFNSQEQLLFEEDYEAVRELRELAGIDQWMSSSVMDYTPDWYQRINGAGRHDRMAIAYGYGDLVDIYDNSRDAEGNGRPPIAPQFINPTNTQRVWAKWYLGGETCSVDADCPYSVEGAQADDLLEANLESGLTQTCLPSDRTQGVSVCSSYEDDARELLASGADRWVPVDYFYCEDIRASTRTLPGCATFDTGDSYREIVRNQQEAYERNYLFDAFRRYRRNFDIGNYFSRILRYMEPMIGIYTNLIYRYAVEPEFRDEVGNFGFYDQFLATADFMNLLARLMSSAPVGGYEYDTRWDRWERAFTLPNDEAELNIEVGLGRHPFSVYQEGLTGINRVERVGSFYDTFLGIQLLTIRGLGLFYDPDVFFSTNFYDLFPNEMQQVFNGIISGRPENYRPRVLCGEPGTADCEDPQLVYMDFYRGDCSEGADATTCRPNPTERYDDLEVLNGGSITTLQLVAAQWSLAQFPIYNDTTFQNQLFICIRGQGDCTVPDGDAVEGVDYVEHTSDRYAQTFLAWQVDATDGVFEQTSIAFEMVKEAREFSDIQGILEDYVGRDGDPPFNLSNLTQEQIDRLDELGYEIPAGQNDVLSEINRLFGRVRALEVVFRSLLQYQRVFSIQPPSPYNRPDL
ncbi:MAG: hypothetical protein ACFCGT_16460 [Sandaracinaceae bacterium]